jgi:hypothetical protein
LTTKSTTKYITNVLSKTQIHVDSGTTFDLNSFQEISLSTFAFNEVEQARLVDLYS